MITAILLFPVLAGLAQDINSAELNELLRKQDEQINTVLFGAMVPIILAFVFLIFIFYRGKREQDVRRRELELKFGKAEMELKSLRAQVNPHFIFNCLASVQHYLQEHDSEQAEAFLVKFSRLIRLTLENTDHSTISLKEDLEALKTYIELERIRFDEKFDYEIRISDDLEPEEVFLPPLLIQPLVENAIWHGLSGQKKDGRIDINMKRKEDFLECTVEDNGSPQENKPKEPVKRRSFGMTLIKERLDLFNDLHNTDANIQLLDKANSSSKLAKILIPIEIEE